MDGVSQVRIALSQAQLVYEVGLHPPAFEIATNAVNIVQVLHEMFTDRFKVTPADLYVNNAVRLSEWAIRLQLLGGRWSVEFRFDGFRATCNQLTSESDVQLAIGTIQLTDQAAGRIFTSPNIRTTTSRLSAWYWCDGGAAAVLEHLARFSPANIGLAPGFEGAQQVHFNLAGNLANIEERWSTRLLIEPSSIQQGNLFIQIEGRYEDGGKYGTLDEKTAHFTHVSQALLRQASLETDSLGREGTR